MKCFFFQAEDGIRDYKVTGVQTCALPICPFLVAAAPPPFILTDSSCGSTSALYTAQFSLRLHPRFLYCPFFVAAAPPLLILTNSRCGSAPDFDADRQRHQLFTARISLRLRPRFLYCPFLVAAAPSLFILTNSQIGRAHV